VDPMHLLQLWMHSLGMYEMSKIDILTVSLKTRDSQSHPRVASFESPWLDITYLLTPWSRALLEKLTVSQLF